MPVKKKALNFQMGLKYKQIKNLVRPKLRLHELKIPFAWYETAQAKKSWRESIALSSQIKETERSDVTVYDTPLLLPKL